MEDNSKSQRFVRASDRIDLKKFERESNRLFLLGLAMGMVFLSIVVSFVTFEKVRIIRARQIPIKLIIRPQSPTKPYRTSREDVIKSIRRKATGMRKPSTGIETKTTPVPDHGEFEITVDYDPDTISSSDMLPDSLLIEEYASRRMMETVPLKNQVLFDTGTYKSEIIISPHNKKAIQGYTHLLYVWGERFDPPTALHHPVIDLADALNLYTNIEAKPAVEKESDKHIPYYPVIYISTDNLLKLDNPSKFLRSGGFYIIDNGASGKYLTEQQRKQIIFILNDIYGSIYTIRPLERRHPIYHCFFDFEDGPPGGSVPDASRTIEGIYIERQLVGIYCPQGYGS
ncbi:MAG: DUF4159 domain-containing protein, partial [Candidatus Latescibacteria bacterium]|nr:DUF4159 domain-containing protein [Candidatus Latescibacterota bacterium]